MRIQELERQVGIERATIRFYEKEGLINPERSENGYRDYSDADAAELRRIKLLRELGVSLDTIRNLQAGKEDFAAVMLRQSRILQGRRDQMERARVVCERISADGVTYIGMDIDHYQNLLNAPLLPQPTWQGSGGAVFEEREYREPHPWRRFFARFLDYEMTSAVLWLLMTVVLRWRFTNDLFTWIIGYAIWYIQVPIEAAWIHFLGTTPGKWIFGIRIEAVEGGKLSYTTALERAWSAFYAGMGLNIPILRLYCFWKGCKAHKEDWDTGWDENCEVSFREFCWKNGVLIALAIAATFGANLLTGLESQLPKYRSDELTVAQFAENYNFINETMFAGSLQPMDEAGQITEPGNTESMVLPDDGEVDYDPFAQFEYELDGDVIKSITFHHTWYARDWYNERAWYGDDYIDRFGWWAPYHCQTAILTALASQDRMTLDEFNRLHAEYVEDCGVSCSDGFTATYGTVTCTWDLDLEVFLDNDETSGQADIYEVTLDLTIKFE